MKNLIIYCISLNPDHLALIKRLNFIPVGLGSLKFTKEWLTDKFNGDISFKNKYYGEYTFHYRLWKEKNLPDTEWIGFCQYRKFWIKKEANFQSLEFDHFKSHLLMEIPNNLSSYDIIIGKDFFVNEFKFMKLLKKRFAKIVFDPSLIFNKKKRTIKFHFDMMHGDGNLDKAIDLLDINEKNDFNEFVNSEVSFNPHNMFICKNKTLLFKYYESLFPWLARCENIFGFDKLEGYGLQRIYGFLAERYMSYWFKKYAKYHLMNIYFKNLNDYLYK